MMLENIETVTSVCGKIANLPQGIETERQNMCEGKLQ